MNAVSLKLIINSSSRYPIRRKGMKQAVEKVLLTMKVTDPVVVEVLIIGDRKMVQLHEQYLHEPGTTDVVSFPLHENFIFNRQSFHFETDGHIHLGSIAVSYPQAQRQAMEHNVTIDEEINHLIEHGMLHLLGIHHE